MHLTEDELLEYAEIGHALATAAEQGTLIIAKVAENEYSVTLGGKGRQHGEGPTLHLALLDVLQARSPKEGKRRA